MGRDREAGEAVNTYSTQPFPHVVVDGTGLDIAAAVEEVQRLMFKVPWDFYNNNNENKRALPFERWPDDVHALRSILATMQSRVFIESLEWHFGIEGLIWNGLGGGVHWIDPGGMLGVHVDFNRSAEGLYRRVNCLLYLDGEPGVGGDLELWTNKEGTDRLVIPLQPDRMVAFQTSERSWHGHPKPYRGSRPRLSVASYYFTEEAPAEVDGAHSTVFV